MKERPLHPIRANLLFISTFQKEIVDQAMTRNGKPAMTLNKVSNRHPRLNLIAIPGLTRNRVN